MPTITPPTRRKDGKLFQVDQSSLDARLGSAPNTEAKHSVRATHEHLQELPEWKSQQKTLWATVLEETKKHQGPVRGKDRTKITELFADERCSKATLDF